MNAIKGLIIKDLLQLKSYKRTLIIFIMIFVLTAVVQENAVQILPVMLTVGVGMFSISSFSYDEMNKADRYILALPISKKQIILSKYIFAIATTVIGSILGILVSYIFMIITNKEITNILEIILTGITGILAVGIIQAIQIPCIYKWGAEKARIQMFLMIIVLAFIIGGIVFLAENVMERVNLPIDNIMNMINIYLPIILLIAIAIIYYISYKVSYKIYSKKEI